MTTARSAFVFAIPLAFLFAACGGSTDTDGTGGSAGTGGNAGSGGGPGCTWNGTPHALGTTWKEACNTCSCDLDGTVGCTLMACGCEYGGNYYNPGDTWTASDGCNQCTCGGDLSVACTETDCAPMCEYNGQYYAPGESWKPDACNTCYCDQNGQSACTGAYCPPECTYAGTTYQVGESFPALDGCNTCTCTDGGIVCTKVACSCDPTTEWWRDYVSTSVNECALIDFACPENTTGFQNACGCGCEQDASCPQTIDCQPPTDCTELKKKCPYSLVAL